MLSQDKAQSRSDVRLLFHADPSVLVQHWIAFQLLHAVAQSHEQGICHGDIKCENVLVTSWHWILLADFASYKPAYLPADNPVSMLLSSTCESHPLSRLYRMS